MKILKANKGNLTEAIEVIKKGKVLICPTDTVYGLVADATDKKTVETIFKIKKRKGGKPSPVFIKDFKMAKKLAKINKKQEEFLGLVWPGKTTVILRPKSKLPKGIGKQGKEIGLRLADCKIINQLLAKFNFPLTATSANISGNPPSVKIKEVISQFKNQKYQPDLVIDSGNLPGNKPSTVIALTVWPPKILRP